VLPVYPLRLNDNWLLINRAIIPDFADESLILVDARLRSPSKIRDLWDC